MNCWSRELSSGCGAGSSSIPCGNFTGKRFSGFIANFIRYKICSQVYIFPRGLYPKLKLSNDIECKPAIFFWKLLRNRLQYGRFEYTVDLEAGPEKQEWWDKWLFIAAISQRPLAVRHNLRCPRARFPTSSLGRYTRNDSPWLLILYVCVLR